jgi:hypothetical protein
MFNLKLEFLAGNSQLIVIIKTTIKSRYKRNHIQMGVEQGSYFPSLTGDVFLKAVVMHINLWVTSAVADINLFLVVLTDFYFKENPRSPP